MTRTDAVQQLIAEGRRERRGYSNAAVQRIVKACRTLRLTDGELIPVLTYLDITDEYGRPYSSLVRAGVKCTWAISPNAGTAHA